MPAAKRAAEAAGAWRSCVRRLADQIALGNPAAFQLTRELLSSPHPPLRGRGWLAVRLASDRPGRHLQGLAELAERAVDELGSDLATLRPLVGPVVKDLRRGLAVIGGGAGLERLGELFSRSSPDRARRLAATAALALMTAAPAETTGIRTSLLRLAVGPLCDQQFLVALAAALADLQSGAAGLDAALLSALGEALWAVVALGRFEVRHDAICALGGLAAAAADPAVSAFLAVPPPGSPGALTAATGEEGGRGRGSAAIRTALGRSYARYGRAIRALAGDRRAESEILDSMETGRRGSFVTAAHALLLPDLWRRASRERREKLRDVVVGMFERAVDLTSSRGPESPQVHRGKSFIQVSLCQAAQRLRHEAELGAAADTAIRRLYEGLRTGIATTLDDALDEHRVAKVACRAMAALVASEDEPWKAAGAAALAEDLRRVAGEDDGGGQRWWGSGRSEAVLEALPVLLVGSRGGDWKLSFLRPLVDLVARLPDPTDLFGTYRYLAAWHAIDGLLEAARNELEKSLPIAALTLLGDGRPAPVPQVEAPLVECLLDLDAERLELFCRPVDEALVAALEGRARLAEPSPHALLTACALELRIVEGLPERFAEWERLASYERFWLTRILWLLGTGSAAGFLSAPGRGRLPGALARIAWEAERLAGIADAEDGASCGPRSRRILEVLRTLPTEAARALGDDLQSLVAGHLPEHELGAADRRLDPDVLALCDPDNSYEVCEELARWIERFQVQARMEVDDLEISETLYQLVLSGPGHALFAHLAARLEDREEFELTELVHKHTKSVAEIDRRQPAEWRLRRIGEQVSELLSDLASFEGRPTLGKVRRLLEAYDALSQVRWKSLHGSADAGSAAAPGEIGLLEDLLLQIDVVSGDLGQPLRLKELCRPELERLTRRLGSYFELGIGHLAEREEVLVILLDDLRRFEARLAGIGQLRPPLSVMLSTVLAAWSGQFQEILEDEVQRARHMVRIGDFDGFYDTFVGGSGAATGAVAEGFSREKVRAYEELFVHWAADRFDLTVLKKRVVRRWSAPLRWAYGVVTSFWGASAVIAAPYLLLIVLSKLERGRGLRGAGFAFATMLVIVVLLAGLGSGTARLYLRRRSAAGERGYAFHCFLPRLITLIVIPMALLLDASHSFAFSREAPSGIIALLLVLTLLGTLFYAAREVTGRGHLDRQLVLQITGLALVEAFAAALVLSAMFGLYPSSATRTCDEEPAAFGLIPRCVDLDLAAALGADDWTPWLKRRIEPRSHLRFLPVAILVWTALGLFSGIFLEGFLRTSAAPRPPPPASS
jgi:hypothetical protein